MQVRTSTIDPYKVYTVGEVAKILQVEPITILRKIKNKKLKATNLASLKIKATKVGREYRINGVDLADMLNIKVSDIACVALEHQLVALDLGRLEAGEREVSPFDNLSTARIKQIAEQSPTRTELIDNLADFIRTNRVNRKKTPRPNSVPDIFIKNSKRDALLEKLSGAMEELHDIYRADPELNIGVFLHQSIVMCADDESLKKFVTDIKKHLAYKKKTR